MNRRTLYADYIKPPADILVAFLLLLIFSWLIIFILLIYIALLQYPIFFRQERIGKKDASFQIIKFRTLKNSKAPLQERRFWLGNFLRFTSLDELPQLINVVKGQMSLVGPRPLPVEYADLFSPEQRKRHLVKPGITGWAQVNGRSSISWKEKLNLDVYYINNVSFWLDIKIIMKTILIILSFRKDTSLEEPKFTGNNHA